MNDFNNMQSTAEEQMKQVGRQAASALNRRADATLASAPTVPGDMCASMQALGDQWLQGRLQSDRH